MGQEKQLKIPAIALKDPQAFELLRLWVAEGNQQISLRTGVFEDAEAWGVLLADLARGIIEQHQRENRNLDAEAFVASMLEGFDQEIESVLEEFGGGEEDHGEPN